LFVLDEILKRGYQVTSEDFCYALENHVSMELIEGLLHHGYVLSRGNLNDPYWSKVRRIETKNAGFNPTKNEYELAVMKGCDFKILSLIEKRMSSKH
jgi:hypothetical protein